MQRPSDPLSYYIFCMTMKLIFCHTPDLAIEILSLITLRPKCNIVPI